MQPKPCNHHWHTTGTVRLSVPAVYQQVCCHCGETREYQTTSIPYNHYLPPPCGPHAPTNILPVPVVDE